MSPATLKKHTGCVADTLKPIAEAKVTVPAKIALLPFGAMSVVVVENEEVGVAELREFQLVPDPVICVPLDTPVHAGAYPVV